MKFRPVRETIEDAMKEIFEAKTWAEMEAHIRYHTHISLAQYPVVVGRYIGPDKRIGWKETYIVLRNGYPVGYLDCNGQDTV